MVQQLSAEIDQWIEECKTGRLASANKKVIMLGPAH